MAQASPFSIWQLLKNSESCAENRCPTWLAWPTNERVICAPSEITVPDEKMKSRAITPDPIRQIASSLLLIDPFSCDATP